jgi:hypothetical protein
MKRKTAHHKAMRRAASILNRGDRTAIELFSAALKIWPDSLIRSGKRLLADFSASDTARTAEDSH